MFLKPIFKTTILSIILFFLVVYLGMKYHWINVFKNEPRKVELVLPNVEQSIEQTPSQENPEESEGFQPQILQDGMVSLEIMNKDQVRQHCQQLYKNISDDTVMFELSVGDCVVSNFQENYKNKLDGIAKNGRQNIQKQINKQCGINVSGMEYSNAIEKQLLMGLCFSKKLSQ